MKPYLNKLFVIAAGVLMAANVNAQCVFTAQFGTATLGDIGQTVTATTCAFAGEYSNFNSATSGNSYQFESTGGSGNYITLTDASNNVLQHGPSPQTLVAPFSGTIRMHYATNAACGIESACRTGKATTLSTYDGPNTLFRVRKTFTDGNPGEVEVSLSCNTGLILDQSKIITADEEVTFVMTDFDSGELNCTVTETPVAGYNTTYSGGTSGNTDGCEYEAVEEGTLNTCDITNTPAPVDIEITKEWVFEGSSGPQGIDLYYELTLWCDSEIVDGYSPEDKFDSASGVMSGCGRIKPKKDSIQGFFPADWCKNFSGHGSEVFNAQVIPEYPDSDCFVVESVSDDAAEVDNGCNNLTVSVGQGAACTITNTVFFEGIPTLSQYGMALMALMMLGIGFVGFRRFA